MTDNPPTVRLPRARPAGVPLALAAFIGFAAGALVGYPFIGAVVGGAIWYVRLRRLGADSES